MADPFVPDPLMRFSPTPFDWTVECAEWTTRIECNNLEMALGLRMAWVGPRGERLARAMKHVRLVVDAGVGYGGAGPEHEDGPMQLVNGPVRTLMHGTGTVLFYDAETRELLGFLSPQMTVDDLLEQFMPALIDNARAAIA